MRQKLSPEMERGRIRHGYYASDPKWGPHGLFEALGPCRQVLRIMACDGKDADALGWEHVSVSLRNRPPNWQEMCWVKDQFWGPEEVVVQFHPARSQYVNFHPHCLHLWRQSGRDFVTPPRELIGPVENAAE